MNQVILMGRVTKDLELNFTSAGKHMLRFSLAVEVNKEKTNFIDVVVFGNSAKYLFNYLKSKGRVAITGTLQNNNYEKNGIKIYSYNVVADKVKIIDFKEKEQEQIENPFKQRYAEDYIRYE